MRISALRRKIRNLFKIVLKDPRRKSLFRILFEYTRFLVTDPVVAEQYFYKYLYIKSANNFGDYKMTRRLRNRCWKLNDGAYASLLNDKYLFELFFSRFGLSVVRSYAHNINSLFFIQEKVIQVNTVDEFINVLESIVKYTPETKSLFLKRTEGSSGGKGIYKISAHDLRTKPTRTEGLFHEIIKSGYIFQEAVVQHDMINRLNPDCLNTIRIDTFTNRQKISKIMSAFIRLGSGGSFVDNVSSGGIYVGIDIDHGNLYAEAHSDFTHGKGLYLTSHPDTGCKFDGYQIPFFEEAKKLVLDAARQIPQVKVIGWDVAIQPNGPVLIEGNDNPGLDFSELAQGGFINNPVFHEMAEEVNKAGTCMRGGQNGRQES